MLPVQTLIQSVPLPGLLFLCGVRTTPHGMHSPAFCNGCWVRASGKPRHWGIFLSPRMSPLKKKLRSSGFTSEDECGYFDGRGKDAADGLAESFDEIVTVAAAAFLARN